MQQQHLRLSSTMFMTLLSILLLYYMLQWYKLKFLPSEISTKSNKQETQILPAGFYLDSKPRMQITQRCFYCEKPLVSAKHKIRGMPSTRHYTVNNGTLFCAWNSSACLSKSFKDPRKRIAYDDSLLIRFR